ncbi:unnamed protein product [Ectocarpus sp. 8 AP-2014]
MHVRTANNVAGGNRAAMGATQVCMHVRTANKDSSMSERAAVATKSNGRDFPIILVPACRRDECFERPRRPLRKRPNTLETLWFTATAAAVAIDFPAAGCARNCASVSGGQALGVFPRRIL